MSLTVQDIKNQSQLIQNDLVKVLDGVDGATLDHVCHMVSDRLEVLEQKLTGATGCECSCHCGGLDENGFCKQPCDGCECDDIPRMRWYKIITDSGENGLVEGIDVYSALVSGGFSQETAKRVIARGWEEVKL